MPAPQVPAYDGWHGGLHPGDSWQDDGSPFDLFQRIGTYGNWAGPGNRHHADLAQIEARRTTDPTYDAYADPTYAAVDPLDAAARVHDFSYGKLAGRTSFSWDGMHTIRDDDRALVDTVGHEMTANGDRYGDSAQTYAKGVEGFFGGRAAGLDAVDWLAARGGEVAGGLGGFVDEAQGWGSLGEVADGVRGGLGDAGGWLADAGSDVGGAFGRGVRAIPRLGIVGSAAGAVGLGNVAVAGAAEAASRLFGWMAD